MPGGWAGLRKDRSTARAKRLAAATLARDGYLCRWVQGGVQCLAPAAEADHINRYGPDELSNMRALCHNHHSRKSSAEGNEARWRFRQSRPAEPHPGVRR